MTLLTRASPSSTSRRITYRPLPAAHRIHQQHEVRERALVGGIGSGKTVGGAWDSVLQALQWNVGLQGMIVAPTYPMLQTSTLRTFLEVLPLGVVRSHNKQDKHIALTNGSEVWYRSAEDYDSLRGPNLAWVWLDEGQKVQGGVGGTWDVLLGRLRASSGASGLVTGTPAGMNWLYERFGKHDPNPDRILGKDYLLVRARTEDNFYLPAEYLRHLRATYVGDFARQELDGEFVAFSGLVYREFRHDLHVGKPPRIDWTDVVAGVDFGFTNPSVILVLGFDADGRAWVLDEFYERRQTEEQLVEAGRILMGQWPIKQFHADGEDPRLIRALRDAGLPVREAIKNVIPGIQTVSARLAVQDDGLPRLCIADHCVNTIREMQTYRYAEQRDGNPAKDQPIKADDHAPDALRYAVMGHDKATDGGFFFA